MRRLVIGTTNQGKLQEWKRFFKDFPIISISDLGTFPEPEEAGKNYSENAKIKAKHYARLTGEFVFSEDGGFEVDALGGLPGVKSRRILPGGKDGTDEELNDYVLSRLKGLPKEKRTARLTFVACVSDPQGKIIFEDADSLEGFVVEEIGPVIIRGYPFRSILFIPEAGKTYAELSEAEHRMFSHKKLAAQRLLNFLLEYK
jgi:XTP/dITP diphosphohydrolase